MGSDLGAAVKGFKDGVRDGGTSQETAEGAPQQVTAAKKSDANTVDVEAKTKS
jgi:sec-independent protein translocase protein TatA